MHNDDKLETLILREGLEALALKLERMDHRAKANHRDLMEAIVASAANDPETVSRIKAITARINATATT